MPSWKKVAQSHELTSNFTPDTSCPFFFISALTVWECVAQNTVFLPVSGTARPVIMKGALGSAQNPVLHSACVLLDGMRVFCPGIRERDVNTSLYSLSSYQEQTDFFSPGPEIVTWLSILPSSLGPREAPFLDFPKLGSNYRSWVVFPRTLVEVSWVTCWLGP